MTPQPRPTPRRNPPKPAHQMRADVDHGRLLERANAVAAAWAAARRDEPIASELFTTAELRDALTALTEELS